MCIRDSATIVEESGLCSAEAFLEAADSYDYNYPFLEELKSRDQNLIGYKLEGFLFPATYEFREDTTSPRDIVDKMLKTFTEYITQDMIQGPLGERTNFSRRRSKLIVRYQPVSRLPQRLSLIHIWGHRRLLLK